MLFLESPLEQFEVLRFFDNKIYGELRLGEDGKDNLINHFVDYSSDFNFVAKVLGQRYTIADFFRIMASFNSNIYFEKKNLFVEISFILLVFFFEYLLTCNSVSVSDMLELFYDIINLTDNMFTFNKEISKDGMFLSSSLVIYYSLYSPLFVNNPFDLDILGTIAVIARDLFEILDVFQFDFQYAYNVCYLVDELGPLDENFLVKDETLKGYLEEADLFLSRLELREGVLVEENFIVNTEILGQYLADYFDLCKLTEQFGQEMETLQPAAIVEKPLICKPLEDSLVIEKPLICPLSNAFLSKKMSVEEVCSRATSIFLLTLYVNDEYSYSSTFKLDDPFLLFDFGLLGKLDNLKSEDFFYLLSHGYDFTEVKKTAELARFEYGKFLGSLNQGLDMPFLISDISHYNGMWIIFKLFCFIWEIPFCAISEMSKAVDRMNSFTPVTIKDYFYLTFCRFPRDFDETTEALFSKIPSAFFIAIAGTCYLFKFVFFLHCKISFIIFGTNLFLVIIFFVIICFFGVSLNNLQVVLLRTPAFILFSFLIVGLRLVISELLSGKIAKFYYYHLIVFLFFFLLVCNICGLIPYTFVLTAQFCFTFFCAFLYFFSINFTGLRLHGVKIIGLFFPTGAPLFIAPLLVIIELISYFARVFSLAIRLFANITAGHILLKIIAWFNWSLSQILLVGFLGNAIILLLWFLEFFISILQAYVFAVLLCIYLNDVIHLH